MLGESDHEWDRVGSGLRDIKSITNLEETSM
jgi:hypothetical protein